MLAGRVVFRGEPGKVQVGTVHEVLDGYESVKGRNQRFDWRTVRLLLVHNSGRKTMRDGVPVGGSGILFQDPKLPIGRSAVSAFRFTRNVCCQQIILHTKRSVIKAA